MYTYFHGYDSSGKNIVFGMLDENGEFKPNKEHSVFGYLNDNGDFIDAREYKSLVNMGDDENIVCKLVVKKDWLYGGTFEEFRAVVVGCAIEYLLNEHGVDLLPNN